MVISTSGGPLPSGRIFNKLNRMHYQPFPPLTKALLQQKIAEGKRYLVCQTFPRGMKPGSCGSLLLRAYSALEKDQAEAHLLSLSSDPNARIYDLVDPHHLKALWQAATQPAGYKVYYAGKKGAGWRPPPHPSWEAIQPAHCATEITPSRPSCLDSCRRRAARARHTGGASLGDGRGP